MMRKMYLATSALVVATPMALATQYGKLPPGQSPMTTGQLERAALAKKGMILDRNGIPIAIRLPVSAAKSGATGKGVNPPAFSPKSYNTFSKSKNALFLSWFGWLARDGVSTYNSSYSYCVSYNSTYTQCLTYEHVKAWGSTTGVQSAAQPFTHVSSASSISVGVGGGGQGRVGIYTNTGTCAKSTTLSCPGTAVPGASGTFTAPSSNGLCCQGLVTVHFAPVSLRKKEKYWIVMSANGAGNKITWYGQDSNFTTPPTGEDRKYAGTFVACRTYPTSGNAGGHTTYCSTGSYSSNGWIHTDSFTFGEQQAAFAVE